MTEQLTDVDQLPSKDQFSCCTLEDVLPTLPWHAREVVQAELQRLREDFHRTESARIAILAENEHYKREAAEANEMLESEWFSRVIYKQQMRAAQPDAARWAFFRKHHMSDYQGKRLHAWLMDNLLRADGIDAAIDEVMAACSGQPPGDGQ